MYKTYAVTPENMGPIAEYVVPFFQRQCSSLSANVNRPC